MHIKTFYSTLFLFIGITVLSAQKESTIHLQDGWKFQPDPDQKGVAEKWFSIDYDDVGWSMISAGKRWEDQGYPDSDGFAWYRRKVVIPGAWENQKIWLALGGVNDAYTLYVDGEKIQSFGDRDTFSVNDVPTVMELSRCLTPGKTHQLALQVYDWGGSGGLWKLPGILTTDVAELPKVPDLSIFYPYDRDELLVSCDLRAMGNERPDGTLLIELFVAGESNPTVKQEISIHKEQSEITIPIPLTEKIRNQSLQIQANVLDQDKKSVLGYPVIVETHRPMRPALPNPYQQLKVMNNFVTELMHTPLSANEKNEFTFLNPRDGWVFIAVANAQKPSVDELPKLYLNSRSEPLVLRINPNNGAGESMQFLSPGSHTIRVELPSESKPEWNLTVRAIPELLYCYYPSSPNLPEQGVYDWKYVQKYVLPHVNVLISSGAPTDEELAQWRREDRRWIGNSSLPGLDRATPPPVDEIYQVWAENRAVQSPDYSGLIVDEFITAGDEHYKAWTDAVVKLHKDANFAHKTFYAFCGDLLMNPSRQVTDFVRTLSELQSRFVVEEYIPEPAAPADAEKSLYSDLQNSCAQAEKAMPGWINHLVMCLGYLSAPPESLNRNPGMNHRVFMEMQFRMLALDPTFWGLYGVMEYSVSYADEEDLRWAHQLMRHYCIEGKTAMLSRDPLLLPHIQNPDFLDGLNGWTMEAAALGSIAAGKQEGFSWLQGRYPTTTIGDQLVSMQRHADKPNRIRQTVKVLEPGRLYSIKLLSADLNHLDQKQKLALNIDLSDVEWIKPYSFQAVYPSNYAHTFGPYNREHPAWFNYHRLVFKPQKETSELVISDWLSAESPGGPIGQTIGFNFCEIQPFLEP